MGVRVQTAVLTLITAAPVPTFTQAGIADTGTMQGAPQRLVSLLSHCHIPRKGLQRLTGQAGLTIFQVFGIANAAPAAISSLWGVACLEGFEI